MVPKELAGKTLGEKHRHYNKLMNDAIANDIKVGSDDFKSENDVENLIKIDIASSKRNVEYILNILKCEDMLYISRAIKQCSWLITDRQYSHIINPEFLHAQLFMQMISKATTKLLLHIRLKLKDEDRVEEFYNYIKEKNIKAAFKWLPNCSLSFIENEIKQNCNEIDYHILKRLCERSESILDKCFELRDFNDFDKLKLARFFLFRKQIKKYFDIVEDIQPYHWPSYGPKHTNRIMKSHPEIIKDNFREYAYNIDIKTFAKFLKKEEIHDFLKELAQKNDSYFRLSYDDLKHFAKRIPYEGFENFKKIFIEKQSNNDWAILCSSSDSPVTSANIYRWYRFAPFDVAFPDLIKLIRAESAPTQRIAIFDVLLSCAGHNPEHLHTLLKYYHDRHINEPFNFKIQFINMVVLRAKTYKFDESTWNILNKIFHSLEVYIESNKNVQLCIEAVIVYKVIHNENESIPEIIKKKFQFKSLKHISKKMENDEKDKVFDYLYKLLTVQLQNINIINESDLLVSIEVLEKIENLLIDWNRELVDYPEILNKIQEIIEIKNTNSWNTNLSPLYNKKKSWRRVMFKESLSIAPSTETCFNALKHDPELLSQQKNEIDKLLLNDNVSLRRLLVALRVYWPQTLANEWRASYLAKLDQGTYGHGALCRGLCTLLPQNELMEILKKYAPIEYKINFGEDDERVLSLRKQLASNMYLARPHPSLDVVLLYACGDYSQFAVPSFNAVLHNMSCANTRLHITKLLHTPVSLQKLGIRFVVTKLKTEEVITEFSKNWKSSKNLSIRAVLFEQTFNLLCKQEDSTIIDEIWKMMVIFIESLTTEENKTIYEILGKVDKVPYSVRGAFLMKSYKILKSLPAESNCESFLINVLCDMPNIMTDLDIDFVVGVVLDTLDDNDDNKKDTFSLNRIISSYLDCDTLQSRSERYQKMFLPILERSRTLWSVQPITNSPANSRENVNHLLCEFLIVARNINFE